MENKVNINILRDNIHGLAILLELVKKEQNIAIKELNNGVKKLEEGVAEVTNNIIGSLEVENEKLRRTLKYMKCKDTDNEIHQQLASSQQNSANYPQIQKLLSKRNYSYCCYENIRNKYEDDWSSSQRLSPSRSSSRRTQSTI